MKVYENKDSGIGIDKVVKVVLEGKEDDFYYNYILSLAEDVADSLGREYSEDEIDVIIAMSISNHMWTMYLNDYKPNEKVLFSHIVNSPTSIDESISSIGDGDKRVALKSYITHLPQTLEIKKGSEDDYELFAFTWFNNSESLKDLIFEGGDISLTLVGGISSEYFKKSETNQIEVGDLMNPQNIKTFYDLSKGIG